MQYRVEMVRQPADFMSGNIKAVMLTSSEHLDPRGRKWQEAGEHCIMRSFITCTLHKIFQIKEYEMGGTCSTYGRDEKCIQIVGRKT
jgi:hypothetical protein